jgi:hypothetical protein
VYIGVVPEKTRFNDFIFLGQSFKEDGGTRGAAGMDKELHIHIIILTKSAISKCRGLVIIKLTIANPVDIY